MDYVVPIIACNTIFYSITSLSTSITSTQNIFKFIIDHKDSDYVLWQRQLETTDLVHKLRITSALIKDIIRTHCIQKNSTEKIEIENLIDEITNPKLKINDNTHNNEYSVIEYSMVDLIKKTSIEINVAEPIKISLLSVLEVINKINNILEKIQRKIESHQNAYFKSMFKICLHDDVNQIISLTNLFNSRLSLLLELLKIYRNILK
jgi:hypothetical protein